MNHTVLNRLSIQTTESNQSNPALDVAGTASFTSNVILGASGTTVHKVVSLATAHDWASVSASTFLEQSFVLPGASTTCAVLVNVEDSKYSGTYRAIVFDGRPATADTVTVKASNLSTAAINMDVLTFRVTAINF